MKEIKNYKEKKAQHKITYEKLPTGIKVCEKKKKFKNDGTDEFTEICDELGIYASAQILDIADDVENNQMPQLAESIAALKKELAEKRSRVKFLRKDFAPDLKEIEDAEDSEPAETEPDLIEGIKGETK